MTDFPGIPRAALDFYAELEQHNSRDWWQAHKRDYEALVREPMEALIAALEPEFGPAHVFRPNRDVRFAADKAPYKTHQGAYCAAGGPAYYVQVDADGLAAGGGIYRMAKDQLARYRRAVDEDLPGEQLDGILDRLDEAGYDIGGDQLATKPRGFTTDHPRLDLLRHKAIHVRRDFGDPDWLATPAALDEVRECWEGLRPLAQWLAQHVGQTDEERR